MTQEEFLKQMNQDYQDLENKLKETPQNYPNPIKWLIENKKAIEQYDSFIASDKPDEYSKTIPISNFTLSSFNNTLIKHLDFLGLFKIHFFFNPLLHNISEEKIEYELSKIFKKTFKNS